MHKPKSEKGQHRQRTLITMVQDHLKKMNANVLTWKGLLQGLTQQKTKITFRGEDKGELHWIWCSARKSEEHFVITHHLSN